MGTIHSLYKWKAPCSLSLSFQVCRVESRDNLRGNSQIAHTVTLRITISKTLKNKDMRFVCYFYCCFELGGYVFHYFKVELKQNNTIFFKLAIYRLRKKVLQISTCGLHPLIKKIGVEIYENTFQTSRKIVLYYH